VILNILRADLLKVKKAIWLIVILGPVGVVAMQAANYAMRFDYLISQSSDKWGFLIENIHNFWPSALVLGITLITSLFASIEHQTNSWKKILSLPVKKIHIYHSKLIIIICMLIVSALILFGGTFLLGVFFGFGGGFPLYSTFKMSFYTLFAATPFIFLQFWLSVNYANQGIALTLGIASSVFTMYSYGLPNWFPWRWPLLSENIDRGMIFAFYGLGLGLLLCISCLFYLSRKDVN
jgi:hypothetical protein